MRIAFLVDTFPSISETFILNQITGLLDAGHEVFIVAGARPDDRDFHTDIRKYDLLNKTYYHNERPRHRLWRFIWALGLFMVYAPRNWTAVCRSLNIFKYKKEAAGLNYYFKVMLFLGLGPIDVFYCQYGPNGNLAALLRELGIKGKIATMFHGYDIRRGIEQGPQIYAKLFEQADCLLSISEYNSQHLMEFKAPKEKIKVHPVGIDLKRYPLVERSLGSPERIRIITVGRLVKEKGTVYAIKAFHQLIQKLPTHDLEYWVIGDGPLRQELESLAQSLHIEHKIRFLGASLQEGVVEALKQSHIFLLPSVAEALPVVLMEAQAMGLPVVATDVGSVRQLVIDGKTGFVVPAGNCEALCERLEYFIMHPSIWGQFGAQGRAHIEQNYNVQQLNARLIKLFEELLRT